MIDPEEIAAAIPQNNKTLEIEARPEIDDVYFDTPYYLTPSGSDAFTLLRDGMKKAKVGAIRRPSCPWQMRKNVFPSVTSP
ncbi:hypothetical protein LPU83_pLPU83d_1643 (plasmid) [Rhizobium favelukesii]|uniref:Ku domain-containing protein n=1 Tax=Rhizobium favelukesii TaxID=348824 RepID=W6RWP2_9HYPH|nr:hypothetical protein LPU83_pLPU83d_1643 [Rhizobium favelukesii]